MCGIPAGSTVAMARDGLCLDECPHGGREFLRLGWLRSLLHAQTVAMSGEPRYSGRISTSAVVPTSRIQLRPSSLLSNQMSRCSPWTALPVSLQV